MYYLPRQVLGSNLVVPQDNLVISLAVYSKTCFCNSVIKYHKNRLTLTFQIHSS